MRRIRGFIVAMVIAALSAPGLAHATTLYPTQDGNEVWSSRYQPLGGNAFGLEPLVAPDGSTLYSVGNVSNGDGSSSYRVVAFDPATGEEMWAAERPGSAHAAALSPDGGRLYLAGITRTDEVTYQDWIVFALDTSDGTQLWSTVHDLPGRRDTPSDVAVAPNGSRVFVVGRVLGFRRQSYNMAALSLIASSGQEDWSDAYDGPAGRYDEATGVAVAPDGNLYVTGFVTRAKTEKYGDHDTRFTTISYGLGHRPHLQDWVTWYQGPGRKPSSDMPSAIVATNDTVYVTGLSFNRDGDPDWLTIAYDPAAAEVRWIDRYNRRAGSEEHSYSMAIGPAGARIYVTGDSGFGDSESITAAYRTRNGTRAWLSRYGTEDHEDIGWDVAPSPDGERVYVTAMSVVRDSEKSDLVTIGYSADNGNVRWATRYGGPNGSDDSFPTVAVQPDSERVFVVGREWDGGNIFFTTIAYRPGAEG